MNKMDFNISNNTNRNYFIFKDLPDDIQSRFYELAGFEEMHSLCNDNIICRQLHKITNVYANDIDLVYDTETGKFKVMTINEYHTKCINSIDDLKGKLMRLLYIYPNKKYVVDSNNKMIIHEENKRELSEETMPIIKDITPKCVTVNGIIMNDKILDCFKLYQIEWIKLYNVTFHKPMKLKHFLSKFGESVVHISVWNCNFILEEDDYEFLSKFKFKASEGLKLGIVKYNHRIFKKYIVPFIANNNKMVDDEEFGIPFTFYFPKIDREEYTNFKVINKMVNDELELLGADVECDFKCSHTGDGSIIKLKFYLHCKGDDDFGEFEESEYEYEANDPGLEDQPYYMQDLVDGGILDEINDADVSDYNETSNDKEALFLDD